MLEWILFSGVGLTVIGNEIGGNQTGTTAVQVDENGVVGVVIDGNNFVSCLNAVLIGGSSHARWLIGPNNYTNVTNEVNGTLPTPSIYMSATETQFKGNIYGLTGLLTDIIGGYNNAWVQLGQNDRATSLLGQRFASGADPAAPAATKRPLPICADNGSGKMQWVARFPTGAVQVIATEP